MNKLDKIIGQIVEFKKKRNFWANKSQITEWVGPQTYDWLCRMLIKNRNLKKPLVPMWHRCIAAYIARSPVGARLELEEARFEYVVSSIIAQEKEAELATKMYEIFLGTHFTNYFTLTHGLTPQELTSAISLGMYKDLYNLTDVLWAEQYYTQRTIEQLPLL